MMENRLSSLLPLNDSENEKLEMEVRRTTYKAPRISYIISKETLIQSLFDFLLYFHKTLYEKM